MTLDRLLRPVGDPVLDVWQVADPHDEVGEEWVVVRVLGYEVVQELAEGEEEEVGPGEGVAREILATPARLF